MTVFTFVALAVAAIGLYRHRPRRRPAKEIGITWRSGADQRSLRLFVGAPPLGIGLGAGLVGALGVGQLLRASDRRPTDPMTWSGSRSLPSSRLQRAFFRRGAQRGSTRSTRCDMSRGHLKSGVPKGHEPMNREKPATKARRHEERLVRERLLRVFVPPWLAFRTFGIAFTGAWLAAASLHAQPPPAPAPGQGRGRGNADNGIERLRAFDPAAVERGRTAFGEKCASCHRERAQTGTTGPDRSARCSCCRTAGGSRHLSRHKPAVTLAAAETTDIGTFLHREITYAAERSNYQLQYVMTGDAKAGETYFNGAGGCGKCHSPTGDLKGIGARNDGPRLQALVAFGTAGGGRGRGEAPVNPRTARKATVTLASGESFSGVLLRLTDFDVTIRDEAGSRCRGCGAGIRRR
jgi:mono/diheme cytochrome c family protein